MSDATVRETAVSRLVGELKSVGGLKGRDIANILGVSPPTVSRWSKGEGGPTIDKQTVLAELRWVAARLADFYAPDEVRLWLQSPHPRPFDLVGSGLDAAGAKHHGMGGVGNKLEWGLPLDLNRLHRRSGRSLAMR